MTSPASVPILTDITRILTVFAHPDDVDSGTVGTVAEWVAQGHEVAYLLVTRGDAGGFDDTPRERVPAIWERGQRAAASAVGVQRVDFLEGYSDGAVTPSLRCGGISRPLSAASGLNASSPVRRGAAGSAWPTRVTSTT